MKIRQTANSSIVEGRSWRGILGHSLSILFVSFFVFLAGCATTSAIETGRAHPSLEMDGKYVKCDGKIVSPYDVADILEEHGVSHDTVVHIRVNQLDRLKEAQGFRILLARAGYKRTALVTKEHAEAWNLDGSKAATPPKGRQSRPRVRYRSANED